jgi:hypothetical protein
VGDIRETVRGDRNWIESILHYIPGFRGYLRKEERRDSDKLLRDHLAAKLDGLKRRIDPIIRDITASGGLAALGDVDRAKSVLDKLAGRIRTASYGYSGMFDAVKIDEQKLDRLYEFDAALVQRMEKLEDSIENLSKAAAGQADHKPALQQVLAIAREMDEHLDNRGKWITDFTA